METIHINQYLIPNSNVCFLHNSGGVLFKVYVIGHMVKVVRRFSLPDISGDEAKTNDIVSFPRVSCAAASADGVDLDPSVGGETRAFFFFFLRGNVQKYLHLSRNSQGYPSFS